MESSEEVGENTIRTSSEEEEEEVEREPSNFENGDGEDEEVEDEEEDEEDEDDEDDDDEEPPRRKPILDASRLIAQRSKLENLVERMRKEKVRLRVHDILIKGNSKTKDSLIEAEVEAIKNASTMQELLEAAGVANANLQRLEIFDSVKITLDSGPPELPGTANVVIEVVEAGNPLSGECGAYTKPAARSWTFEGSVKYKNWLGYGDLWDGSLAYGPNQTSEVSAGVYLPRLKRLMTPLVARLSLLSQDWMEFSSYKERSLGLSLGLYSTKYHDLGYNLGWRTITDPSQMASNSIRRQLGNSLLSSLKYTFKVDKRNSAVRPTRGYAFVSTSQIGGLAPDHRSLRFVRQEFDLRYAIPFGFDRAAMNFGVSAGVVLPWGNGFLNKPSSLPERFFLGGDFSPVCTIGGPTTVWGFKTRGMGPTEPRREVRDENKGKDNDALGRDFVGGDLAVTAFADLSFDLPLRWLREHGIHGHIFAGAGNLAKLTENEFRSFSFQKFMETFRTSVGVGIVVPTRLFRLEGNFYYILKQQEHDRGKTGFRFSISAPS
ncbi:sorting and assembly machinery component 50 homolog B-like [Cucurbita maxima]|uniref:Sorting and assembly machinery component 50 homolog B-like n=1 Tax=Cucurbita maxima TaxID=3661 RepID=A0A6J1K1Q1_CUCMA|nr:sorting and assembly machinery component 50 homolog B-like [Cucurbita maxima]XP_022993264.1 sorting and assembly machinery component 50 homolog B-like [Cucurbita maxima]